jgi:isopentenyl diphosphate isomerase/L-lactate dehydrogenase-like FMN-dependent dehydrogenase
VADAFNLRDFEELARSCMDPGQFAFYAGGSLDEVTLAENQVAFARRRLRPRVLIDVSEIDTGVTLLGHDFASPVGIAPTAQHGLAHPDAECATVRAARDAGTLFVISTMSTRPVEEIGEATTATTWFQLYTRDDCGPRTEALIRRAESAACKALVLTVDLAVPGRRERELRANLDMSLLRPGNFPDDSFAPGAFAPPPSRLNWNDLAWLRRTTALPIVLKGIMTAEDAHLAVEHGIDAVWVSNHGGRQLDRSCATIDVLEEVVDAVAGHAEVYIDGGVRRGTDVVTSLALGARAVFLGRPILYALACDGQDGVSRALEIINSELRYAMALLGTPSIAAINRTHLAS